MADARRVGERTEPERRRCVRNALTMIRDAALQARDSERGLSGENAGDANVVWDLTGAIERLTGERLDTVRAVAEPKRSRLLAESAMPVEISVDAVAGAVRALFKEAPPGDVTDDAVRVVTGALVIAATVADDPDAGERGERLERRWLSSQLHLLLRKFRTGHHACTRSATTARASPTRRRRWPSHRRRTASRDRSARTPPPA